MKEFGDIQKLREYWLEINQKSFIAKLNNIILEEEICHFPNI